MFWILDRRELLYAAKIFSINSAVVGTGSVLWKNYKEFKWEQDNARSIESIKRDLLEDRSLENLRLDMEYADLWDDHTDYPMMEAEVQVEESLYGKDSQMKEIGFNVFDQMYSEFPEPDLYMISFDEQGFSYFIDNDEIDYWQKYSDKSLKEAYMEAVQVEE